ncbi:MAG: SDR family oxidoreductase [Candidatus Heimdallarchaeaceae archaeon]
MVEKIAEKPVLITGASSGIGRKTVELLIDKGKEVYAAARKEKDIETLNKLENTTAIKLDVTKPQEIAEAVHFIRKREKGLYGLVNNAGIADVGAIFTHSEEAMYKLFDVNVFGVHRLTNAILPFLFESRGGRIVTIGSISGILSGQLLGLYSMSKHALEAYTDTLYLSLKEIGIEVSIIEPGNFKSEIGLSMFNRIKKEDKSLRHLITEEQRKMLLKEVEDSFVEKDDDPEPDKVAEAIYNALYSKKPKQRYLVTGNQEEARWVMRKMLLELSQMNTHHEHSFTREEIIEMFDEIKNKYDFSF